MLQKKSILSFLIINDIKIMAVESHDKKLDDF